MPINTYPRCAHAHVVKNGTTLGKARYKCRGCGYQFTRRDKRGQPQRVVHTAVLLYLFGLSMNAIARLLGVSTPAVLYWIRTTARPLAQKPTPKPGQVVALELDEMWHFLEKTQKLWIWKAYDRTTGHLLDWECGHRDRATLQRLVERLKAWNVLVDCTDHWECYRDVIAGAKLVQSKTQTVAIERNNGRQRHWLGRFRRRTVMVSRSQEMVNLSMALFAAFHVNHTLPTLESLFN